MNLKEQQLEELAQQLAIQVNLFLKDKIIAGGEIKLHITMGTHSLVRYNTKLESPMQAPRRRKKPRHLRVLT